MRRLLTDLQSLCVTGMLLCVPGCTASDTPAKPAVEEPPTPCAVAQLPRSVRGDKDPGLPVVAVGSESLCVEGQPVAPLKGGVPDPATVERHLIKPLRDALVPVAEKSRAGVLAAEARPGEPARELLPLTILAPASLPFSALVDIAYTAGRAEFSRYFVGVEGANRQRGFLRVDPPLFSIGQLETRTIKIFIMEDGLRVGASYLDVGLDDGHGYTTIPLANPERPLGDPNRWDLAALGERLDQIKRVAPEVVDATVSCENTIPLGAIAGVLDVAAGEGCPADHKPGREPVKACRFPAFTIEAGAG